MNIDCIPNEIIIQIIKHLNVRNLSTLFYLNKTFNEKLNDLDKWYLIDAMNNAEYSKLIPKTKETYINYRYCINWNELIIRKCKIPEDVIQWIENKTDVSVISIYQDFSTNLLYKIYHLISYKTLLSHQILPIDILYDIIQNNSLGSHEWYHICSKQKLDINFIKTYIDFIQWNPLSQNKHIINHEIINTYHNKLVWQELTKHGVNEYILIKYTEYFDFICWSNISQYSVLSSYFIHTFLHFLDLEIIFRFQKISDQLLNIIVENFSDIESSYFQSIGLNQNLSKNFIIKYKNFLPINILIRNKNIKRKLLHDIF